MKKGVEAFEYAGLVMIRQQVGPLTHGPIEVQSLIMTTDQARELHIQLTPIVQED